MRMTRRTASGGILAMAAMALGQTVVAAKDNKPGGGFGATASVSVNSGNNSGNQSFQENQAILTEDASGQITVQQGNASGSGSVQQGSVQSSGAIEPVGVACPVPDFSHCSTINLCQPDGTTVVFVNLTCARRASGQ